jgi:hypothetical protein
MFHESMMSGTSTWAAEVTHISRFGFWMLPGEEALLRSFKQFPWFKQAKVGHPNPNHPDLHSLAVDR